MRIQEIVYHDQAIMRMELITVYQRRSIRNGGGGGGRSEKSQHKGFHRRYGRRIGE
jgi:hypothetical protein